MKRLLFSILVAAALSACTTVAPLADHPRAFVVRHFEKADGADPLLSEAGLARAAALAERLEDVRIVAVYSTDTRRTRLTAEPTAKRHNLAIIPYQPSDTDGLVQAIARAGGSVLIVGHSNTVPEIVARLSGQAQRPMPETQYGDLFVVDLVSRAVTSERIGD